MGIPEDSGTHRKFAFLFSLLATGRLPACFWSRVLDTRWGIVVFFFPVCYKAATSMLLVLVCQTNIISLSLPATGGEPICY